MNESELKLVNLTPHEVVVLLENGTYVTFSPKDKKNPARVSTTLELVTIAEKGVPIVVVKHRCTLNLPREIKGTLYIVSHIVKANNSLRLDLVSPVMAETKTTDGRKYKYVKQLIR